MNFTDSLRKHGQIFDELASASKVLEGPLLFGELYDWGESVDVRDVLEWCKDPGIMFDREERRFVLIRIENEIRYYAGTNDPDNPNPDTEMGTFPTEVAALTFGHEYLLSRRPLDEIEIERSIRSLSRTGKSQP